MSSDLESTFSSWTNPPSDTEEQKCVNAEGMIKDAIHAYPVLSEKNIQIFAQGSYKNNTNVRLDSDIDICVRLMDVFFFDLPEGRDQSEFGIIPSSYPFSEYKDSVEIALVSKFGKEAIKRGNKAIKVAPTSYRSGADVVACFEHRRYSGNRDWSGGFQYLSGTEFRTEKGERIVNWPIQHYENGVAKNRDTGRRFKRTVRILKKLNLAMEEQGVRISQRISSFLIECLVWNVSNGILTRYSNYTDTVKNVLYHLYHHTENEQLCDEWGEVSELLYLFRGRKWTKKDVNTFTIAAWNYLGLG